MKCCICGTELVSTGEKSNCSQEHIIPNAIGGILKSSDIYCKTCNSNMGTDIDKAFCDIFASIVNNLDMHFDRKKMQLHTKELCMMQKEIYTMSNLKIIK